MSLTKFTFSLSDHGDLLSVKTETGYAGEIPSISVRRRSAGQGQIADVVEKTFVDALLLAHQTNHLSMSDQCLTLASVDSLLLSSDSVIAVPKKVLAALRGMVLAPLDYMEAPQ